MGFNSLEFLLFTSTFLILFFFLRKKTFTQNLGITLFSLVFYALGDLSHVPLILVVGIFNYYMAQTRLQKTWQLYTTLAVNLGILILGKLQFTLNGHFPLGLSFYIFQGMSFIIDLHRGKTPLPKNFWHFQSYLLFFPQLLAGPICRPAELMGQLDHPIPTPSKVMIRTGLYLVSLGLLKKAVVADAIGIKVDEVFNNIAATNDLLSWVVVIFAYGWQIYFDFSGYSDMARGLAKIVGIELPINFSFPYFAKSPKDFWNRWHITLSHWFRDYVYIPLGGSRKGTEFFILSLFISFILSALWHGLGWNYLFWGLWHAMWICISHFFWRTSPIAFTRIATLLIVFTGWIFFRGRDEGQSLHIFKSLLNIQDVNLQFTWLRFNDLILLSILATLIEAGTFYFKQRYHSMKVIYIDAIWALMTIVALLFQSPVREFIYFRF